MVKLVSKLPDLADEWQAHACVCGKKELSCVY